MWINALQSILYILRHTACGTQQRFTRMHHAVKYRWHRLLYDYPTTKPLGSAHDGLESRRPAH